MDDAKSLAGMTPRELLCLHSAAISALEAKDVVTTRNNPVGGYGEWLVASAFDGTRQPNSNKGVRVVASDGARLQVRTRWLAVEGDSRQLGAIRYLDKELFDSLVAVFLDPEFRVAEAYRISHSAVRRLATHVETTNSYRLVLSPTLCRSRDCVDITEMIRAAESP